MNVKGIVIFPTIFVPKVAKGADKPKFSITVLLPPTDPQVPVLQAELDAAKANGFPSGYTGKSECFAPYDVKYAGKKYYDVRFTGWFVFSCTSPEDDRPDVVDEQYNKVIDPGAVHSGMICTVNAGISAFLKGSTGIGGWLNGVMVSSEELPFGRLDGRPTVQQMFGGTPPPAAVGGGVTPAAPPVPTPVPPPAPVAAPPTLTGLVMTPAANGVSLADYLANGWTEQQLIDGGMAIKPSFA